MIADLATTLVQTAPDLDPLTVGALRRALDDVGSPLALSISRIVELVAEQLVDPGIALPAIAEACATLEAGIRGEVDDKVLEAARYQIDTLEPVPDRSPQLVAPDVPLSHVRRRQT